MLASYLFLFNSSNKYNVNEQILLQQKYIFSRNLKIIKSQNFFIFLSIARGDIFDYFYEDDDFLFIGDYAIYNIRELSDIVKLNNDKIIVPEILVELFRKFDIDSVKYIDGDFSFLIYDKKKAIIYIFRDRLGIRPVYYYNKDDFIVSNELRLIVAIKKNYLTINLNEFFDSLLTINDDHESTVYKEIIRLPLSSCLSFKEENLYIKNFWKPDLGEYMIFENENEYVELFGKTLIESIEKRCKDWNVISSELSGGLDSSVITIVANNYAKNTNKNFIAFSNVFNSNQIFRNKKDEKEYIDEILKYNNNINWFGIDFINWDYIDLLKFSLDIQGVFVKQNFPVFNISIYETAYKNNVNILLSGFGGDELVSSHHGIPWMELLEKKDFKNIYSFLVNLPKGKIPLKSIKILSKYLLFKCLNKKPVLLDISKKFLKERFSHLSINKKLMKQYNFKKKFIEYYHQKIPYFVDDRQFFRLTQPYLPMRLEYSYAIASQYGIEYRYPLLDFKLIQLYFSYPLRIRFSDNIKRYLYRNSVKGIIPEKIRLRNDKFGTVIPQAFIHFYQQQNSIKNFLLYLLNDKDINKVIDIEKMIIWHQKLLKEERLNNKMYTAFNIYVGILLWMIENKDLWKNYF